MGLRETLNRNPGITTIATALIVVVALVFVIFSFTRGNGEVGGPSNKTWFSADDGETWFADDRSKVPPFDHDGKQAVRAYVFQCDGGKVKFVGWLERYTTDTKKRIEQLRASGGSAFSLEVEDRSGVEVKKPKTGKWVRQTDPEAAAILDVKCPDGSIETLELLPDP